MEKFRKKYSIESARIKNWDYGSPGLYFVTICTNNRELFFGKIIETKDFSILLPLLLGVIANKYWSEIPEHFQFVHIDEYAVIPNHIHGILLIDKLDYIEWRVNEFGPQSKNLGSIIRGFKAGVKTFSTDNKIDFCWQPRFYDWVIRSEDELNRIRKYIIDNPNNWKKDKDNIENLYM